MNSLGDFSTAFLPSVEALGGAATDINTFVTGTPKFAGLGAEALDDARRQHRHRGPRAAEVAPADPGPRLADQAGQAARDEPVAAAALARRSRAGSTASSTSSSTSAARRTATTSTATTSARASCSRTCTTYATREPAELHRELPQGLRRRHDADADERRRIRLAHRREHRLRRGRRHSRRSPRAPPRRTIKLPGTLLPGDGASRRSAGAAPGRTPQGRRARGRPEVRPAPPRLPPRSMRRRGGGGSIAANPVLIGAVTVLVVIVAVYLAYNANSGLPFVPDVRPQGRGAERGRAGQGQRRPRRRHARRHRVVHRAADAAERRGHRGPLPEARDGRQAAARGHAGEDPAAVRARPEVRPAHARRRRRRTSRRTRRSRCARRCRSPSSSTSSSTCSPSARGARSRATSRTSAPASPRAARTSTSRSATSTRCSTTSSRSCATSRARRPTCRASGTAWRRAPPPSRRSPRCRGEMYANLDTTFSALAEVADPYIKETIAEGPPTLQHGDPHAADHPAVPRQHGRALHRLPARLRELRGRRAGPRDGRPRRHARARGLAGVQRAPGDDVQGARDVQHRPAGQARLQGPDVDRVDRRPAGLATSRRRRSPATTWACSSRTCRARSARAARTARRCAWRSSPPRAVSRCPTSRTSTTRCSRRTTRAARRPRRPTARPAPATTRRTSCTRTRSRSPRRRRSRSPARPRNEKFLPGKLVIGNVPGQTPDHAPLRLEAHAGRAAGA